VTALHSVLVWMQAQLERLLGLVYPHTYFPGSVMEHFMTFLVVFAAALIVLAAIKLVFALAKSKSRFPFVIAHLAALFILYCCLDHFEWLPAARSWILGLFS